MKGAGGAEIPPSSRSRFKDIHGNIFYQTKKKYPFTYHNINDGNLYVTKGINGNKYRFDGDGEYVLRDNTVFNKVDTFNKVDKQHKFKNASTGEEVTKYLNPESLPEPKKELKEEKTSFFSKLKAKIPQNPLKGGKRRTRRRRQRSNKKRTNKRKKTKTRMKKRKTHKRKTNKRRRKR